MPPRVDPEVEPDGNAVPEPSPGNGGLRGRLDARCWMGMLAVGAFMSGYYAWVWGDLDGFLKAVAKNPRLFEDLLIYFHPMGRDIFLLQAPIFGYFYSAFFAVMLAPLGAMDFGLAAWIWGLLQVAAFSGVFLVPLRRLLPLSRTGIVVYFAVFVSSVPALHNFTWGQVGMFLTLGTLAALDASMHRRPWLAGGWLGMTSAIKYYPGLFLFYLLIRRDHRAVLAFVLAGAVCFAVIPAILIGPVDWFNFHLKITEKVAEIDWITPDPNSQHFVHVVFRWLGWPPVNPADPGAPARILGLGGYGVLGLILLAAEGLRRRRHPVGPALSASALFLAYPFLLATSWPHYFVYLPFCQAAVGLGLARETGAPPWLRKFLCVFPAISVGLSSVFVFNLFPEYVVYQTWGCLFLANTLLLPPILVLGLLPTRGEVASPARDS